MHRPMKCATCVASHDPGCRSCWTKFSPTRPTKTLAHFRLATGANFRSLAMHSTNQRRDPSTAAFGSTCFFAGTEIGRAGMSRATTSSTASCKLARSSYSVQKKVIPQQSISAMGSSGRKQRDEKHDFDPRCWPRCTSIQDGFC